MASLDPALLEKETVILMYPEQRTRQMIDALVQERHIAGAAICPVSPETTLTWFVRSTVQKDADSQKTEKSAPCGIESAAGSAFFVGWKG